MILLTDEEISQVVQRDTIKWQPINPLFVEGIAHVVCKAQFSKVVEWLESPCTEHERPFKSLAMRQYKKDGKIFMSYKGDCPECWEKLKREVKPQ